VRAAFSAPEGGCQRGNRGGNGSELRASSRGQPPKSVRQRVDWGWYRAQPVRRAHVSKSDGGQRPLGVPALEDKVFQGAVTNLLGVI
jgi:hypothetical protein